MSFSATGGPTKCPMVPIQSTSTYFSGRRVFCSTITLKVTVTPSMLSSQIEVFEFVGFVELQPYKYAGYPNLLVTIQLEIDDDQLFAKSLPLLPSATELAYHTVHCSALNAEELRRENGLKILQAAMLKCMTNVTKSSKPEEMPVQVCRNAIMCYTVAAQFEESRKELLEMPNVVKTLCRLLSMKVARIPL